MERTLDQARDFGVRRLPTVTMLAYGVLVFCLLALVGLRWGFLRSNGPTFDEFVHLEAGYRYWQCGEFANNPEHPPLAKFVAAFPVRQWRLSGFPSPCGTAVVRSRRDDLPIGLALFHSPHGAELLWKSRSALVVFPLLLVAVTFFAARRLFGEEAAIVAALLATFEPTLLTHGSLVTTDMAVAVFLLASVWGAIEYVLKPRWGTLLATSVAVGLGLASKHSAVALPVLVLLAMVVTLLVRGRATRGREWARVGLGYLGMLAIGWAILWSTYGFRYAALPQESRPAYDLGATFDGAHMEHAASKHVVLFAAKHHLLPEAYLAGLTDVLTFNERPTFFFGQYRMKGIWYYFPAALSIKLTVGLLVLFALAVVLPGVYRRHGRNLLPVLAVAVAFMAFAMNSKLNIGVRHVLPVVPLMIVVASAGAAAMMRSGRSGRVVVVVCVVAALASALRAAPHQLSYANELWGGPNRLYHLLGDSNVDWGQADAAVQTFVAERKLAPARCAVASGTVYRNPSACVELPTLLGDLFAPSMPPVLPDQFDGTVIVQPLAESWSSAYTSFLNRTPDEVLGGGTVLVYRGRTDLSQVAAVRRLYRGLRMLIGNQPALAMQEFASARGRLTAGDQAMLDGILASAPRPQ